MSDIRKIAINMLTTVFTEQKNAEIFEKNLYKQAEKISAEENFEDIYLWITYQIIGHLIQDKTMVKQYLADIKAGRVGWTDTCYDNVSKKLDEHDDYIVSPFEVVEGVISCPRCKCAKTWSVQKQVRSSDEPMTTFSRCVECDNQWVYSG